MDNPFQDNPTTSYSYNQPKKGTKKFVYILLALVVLGLLFFGYKRFFASKQKATPAPTPTPMSASPTDTPTPSVSVSVSPSPTVSAKSTPTPSPTSKPTANPIDSSTGLDRSKLSVTVQNGSGTAGAGSKAADILKSLGYNIASTGNADNFNYDKTVIEVSSAKSTYLPLLQKDLGNYTIGTTSASFSGSSDALVIIGKQ